MTGQDIFNLTMDLLGKRQSNGAIDPTKTTMYKVRSPGLLTLWQNKMQVFLDQDISEPITDISQEITVNDPVSGPYYLAAKLLLVEDPDSASFFEEKFNELKTKVIKSSPATSTDTEDVY